MPANLPAEARAKWKKVMEARNPEEKLKALQEFLSSIPKHKGTEKLRALVKRQIAKTREEIEKRKEKKGKRQGFFVKKDGDIQLVLLGLPNSGKSYLTGQLTNAKVVSTPAPFETQKPIPAMMQYEGVYVQIIDTPSIFKGAAHSSGKGLAVLALARNADIIGLVIGPSYDPEYQLKTLLEELEEARIRVTKNKGIVKITKRTAGGIVLRGNSTVNRKEVEEILKMYSIYHAEIYINGPVTLDDIEQAIFGEITYRPSIAIGVMLKDPRNVREICEKYGIIFLNYDPKSKEDFKKEFIRKILNELQLIRVYTKPRYAEKPTPKPLIIPKGTPVIEIAKRIHSSLYKNFKYARIWSPQRNMRWIRVGRDYTPLDGDVIEIVA